MLKRYFVGCTGCPNQKLLIQMAITLKICISDPELVKPKCVSEAYIYIDFSPVCLHFQLFVYNFQNVRLSNIFWHYQLRVRNVYFQSYSHSATFDLGHPVLGDFT